MTTSLDTLLERLDKLDEKRTPGPWGGYVTADDYHIYTVGPMHLASQSDCSLRAQQDCEFMTEAVNTNATLREVIRVQQKALEGYAVPFMGEFQWRAKEALNRVEEICKK